MRRLALILSFVFLLTAITASGAPNAQVTITAPQSAVPGETVQVSVHTSIAGVPVISVPTQLRLIDSSGERLIGLASEGDGTYSGSVYLPRQGQARLVAEVQVGAAVYESTAVIDVAPPQLPATIMVDADSVNVNAELPLEVRASVFEPVPGTLADQDVQAACSQTCQRCEISCDIAGSLVHVRIPGSFTYDLLRATNTQTRSVAANEPIDTSGMMRYTDGRFVALPEVTRVTENMQLVSREQGVWTLTDVIVLDKGATPVEATRAYGAGDGHWYVFDTQDRNAPELVKPVIGNATIINAHSLETGQELDHTLSTLVTQGPFEAQVRLVANPPALPDVSTSRYGALVTGNTSVKLRYATQDSAVYDLTSRLGQPALIPTYTGQNASIYYARNDHVRLEASPIAAIEGSNVSTYTPVFHGTEYSLAVPPSTTGLLVLDSELRQVSVQQAEGPLITWSTQLPPGRYFVLLETRLGSGPSYAFPVQVFERAAGLLLDAADEITGSPNTAVNASYTLTNAQNSTATVDVSVDSPYRTILYGADGLRLADTDLDGIPDLGPLAAGASRTVRAEILLPPGAADSIIMLNFSAGRESVAVTQSVRVEAPEEFFLEEDVAVTAINEAPDGIVVELYNYHDAPRALELSVRKRVDGTVFQELVSVEAPPGSSLHPVPLEPGVEAVTVTAQLDDERPANNARSRFLTGEQGPDALLVPVSEQQHTDRPGYQVKVTVPQGEWTVRYPDGSGGLVEGAIAVLENSGEGQQLLLRMDVPASTDFDAVLTPGSGQSFEPYRVIDNNHPSVSRTGTWFAASQVPGFYGSDYLTDLDAGKGDKLVTYRVADASRQYEIEAWSPGDQILAANSRISIGEDTVILDQTKPARWKYLGRYELDSSTPIVVSNAATDGFVVADAFRLLAVDQYASAASQRTEQVPVEDVVENGTEQVNGTSNATSLPNATVRGADRRPLLFDSAGRPVVASMNLRRDGRAEHRNIPAGRARNFSGEYEIEIVPPAGPVDRIIIHSADPSTARLGLEKVSIARAQQFTSRNVVDAYAIDPRFDSDYTVTRVARGRELLKCTDYNFTTQTCFGEFLRVRSITPGQPYTVTLDPLDPILIEVDDEILPPVYAVCDAGGGAYSTGNCGSTYDDSAQCTDELVWCNEASPSANIESWTVKKENTVGIIANYSDSSRDPVSQCDEILAVWVDYEAWGGSFSIDVDVDADGDGFDSLVAGRGDRATEGTTDSDDATGVLGGGETWDCEDFFGENATARIRLQADSPTGGSPFTDYTFNIDYLVFRIDYNYTQFPVETDRKTYVQGESVNITGSDIWDAAADVTLNISVAGSVIEQINVTTNASGQFDTLYVLSDYQTTGSHSIYAWQRNDTTINGSNTFTVNTRTPTVTASRDGNFYNRSEMVRFEGSFWAKSTNVTVNASGPEGDSVTLSQSSNLSDASGGLVFHWTVPSDLGTLTGPYTFTFIEEVNATYNATDTVQVVILPSAAQNNDGANQYTEIFTKDLVYAVFNDNNGGTEWLRVDFPPTLPSTGIKITEVKANFFHYTSDGINEDLRWLNDTSGSWEVICTLTAPGAAQWDECDLTSAVNGSASDYNDINIRFTDAASDFWPGGTTFNYDIAYLSINYTFPPPDVTLEAPANDSWFSSDVQTLRYNATNAFFNIPECRVYVNSSLQYTNSSFVTNSSDHYDHDFSEGTHTWYAACDDDSSRALTGTSQTRTINIDLTDPVVAINSPSVNYSWFNDSTPPINFTLTDNLDSVLDWNLYVNDVLETSGTQGNSSWFEYSLTGKADGLYNVTVEAFDESGRYATNRTVWLYIDTKLPSIELNEPVEQFNTTSTSITFNWTATDNLDSSLICDVYVNDVLNVSSIASPSGSPTSQLTGPYADGFYNWTVHCADESAGLNVSSTRNFTVDTVAPSVSLNDPANYSKMLASPVTLNWTVSDAISSTMLCDVQVDGALVRTDVASASGSPTTISEPLADARHTWNVTCRDDAGNNGTSIVNTFWVDSERPYLNFVAPTPANDTNQSSQSVPINISSNDENLHYVFTDFGRDLVLWMTMDERDGSDNPLDNSTYGNDGTLTSAVPVTTGRFGDAFEFTDSAERITMPAGPEFDLTDQFTLSAWIRPDTGGPNDYQVILNKQVGGFADRNFWLVLWTDGRLTMRFSSSADNTDCDVQGGPDLRDGSWHHVAGVYNGSECRIYTDGALVNSDPTSGAPEGVGGDVWIGTEDGNTGRGFDGLIDEVFIWNRTMGATQIGALHNATSSPYDVQVRGLPDGIYHYTGYARDVADRTNSTEQRTVTIDTTPPNVSLEAPANNTVFDTTRDVQLDYNVTDLLQPVQSCTLYVNDQFNESDPTITEGLTQSFNLLNLSLGRYNWTVECQDDLGNVGNSSTRYFDVNVSVNPFSPANGTVVDRDSVSGDPDKIILVANLSDSQQSVPVTFRVNLTMPSSQTNIYLGVNVTNSSGQAVFHWNPNATLYAGNYSWWPNSTDYVQAGTRYAHVYGSASVEFSDNADAPREEYNSSQSVQLWANVSSPGPESELELNNTYGAYVAGTADNPSQDQTLSATLRYNGSLWNDTVTLPADAEVGEWNNTLNFTSAWFYDSSQTNRIFAVKGFGNAISPANGTDVDRDSVSADSDVIKLVARIPGVRTAYTVNFSANLTTLAGSTDLLLGSNTTNGSGHVVLHFNPDPTYFAGRYVWYIESNVSYVNETRTFDVIGSLDVEYWNSTFFPDVNYTQNESASFRFNLTSVGPENRSEINLSYSGAMDVNVSSVKGAAVRSASFTEPYWNASLALLTVEGVGVWNVTANATSQYHYPSSGLSRNFTVYGYMNVSNATMQVDPTQVYSYARSLCAVEDMHTSDDVQGANVSFYRDGTFVGWNTTGASGWAQLHFQTNTSGTYTVTCNVTDQPGIYYFAGEPSEDTVQMNVTPYLITPISPANNTRVDRDAGSASMDDVIRLEVRVPSFVPDGINISFWGNTTTPLGQSSTRLGYNTTSTGRAVLYVNPVATNVSGVWNWSANATSGARNGSRLYDLYANPELRFWNNTFFPDVNYTQNETAQFRFNLTSPGSETRDQLDTAFDASVSAQVNGSSGASVVTHAYSSPYWTGSLGLLAVEGVGVWNVTANSSGDYLLNTSSLLRTFEVFGYMNMSNATLQPSSIFVYQTTRQTCFVEDVHTGVDVQGVSVSFYRNGTLLGSNTTDSLGRSVYIFQTNTTGIHNISCNVSSQPDEYYFASQLNEDSALLTVNPFPITPVNPANGTDVDRDSARSSVPDKVILDVSVPDFIPDGIQITFRANTTRPSSQAWTTLGSNTTQAGHAVLHWNPPSSFRAGVWNWSGNNSGGYRNGSREVDVYGQLFAEYWNSTFFPDENYTLNQSASARFNVTSLGPATRAQLDSDYSASVNATYVSPGGSALDAASFTSPYWNSSLRLLVLGDVGVWNVSGRSGSAYFYTANVSARNFTVYGYMNVTANTISPEPIYAYQNTTSVCRVQDQHTQRNVSGAQVSFFLNGSSLGSSTTNATGHASINFQVNQSGLYDVLCNVSDQLSIFYYAGGAAGLNATLNVTPFPITPRFPANGTDVDRDSASASMPDKLILNISVPGVVGDGVNISFFGNSTSPLSQADTLLGWNTTADGYAILHFDPPTGYVAGGWTWRGQADEGTLNGTRTFDVYGDLVLRFWNSTFFPDVNYTQNETAGFRFNLTSIGSESREQINDSFLAAVDATVRGTNGSSSIPQSYLGSYWDSSVSLLSIGGVGVWNVSANASADYFINTTLARRSFEVFGFMNVSNATLSQSTITAFQTTRQTCFVEDVHTGVDVQGVSVGFYRDGTLLGSNVTGSLGQAVYIFQTNTTGTYNISCNVSSQPDEYYLASELNEDSALLTVNPFLLTPRAPVNGTDVDRDSGSPSVDDVIVLNVSVQSFIPDGVNVSFWGNTTNPVSQADTFLGWNTTAGGYAILHFNPDSTVSAGNWSWSANSSAGDANGSRHFDVFGLLNVRFFNNTFFPDINYTLNETASFRFNVTTAGPESRSQIAAAFNANLNASVQSNLSDGNFSGSFVNPYWSSSLNLLVFGDVGVWNVSANSTADYMYASSSPSRDFEVYSYMNATESNLSPTTHFVYDSARSTCRVQDQFTDRSVAFADVSFFRDGVFVGSNTTNSSGHAQISFQTNSSGTYTITCNVSDQPDIYYFAGDAPERNETLTVLPFPVTPVAPSNGTDVDRDSGDAGMSDIVVLNVSVPDYVPDGVSVSFFGNTSVPLSQSDTLLGINTTVSGYAVLYWNPNATISAGNWSWFANSSSGAKNGSRLLDVFGLLDARFNNNTFDPDVNYTLNETARFRFNLTTAGPETRDELNDSFLASVNASIFSPGGSVLQSASWINPYWEASYGLLGLGDVGVWNVTGLSGAQYMIADNTTPRNFTVFSYMNVTSASLDPSAMFAYQSSRHACRVQDAFTSSGVSGALVSFYRNGTLLGTNNTNASGQAIYNFQVNQTGTYNISCNVSDQTSIYYLASEQNEGSSLLTVNLFPILPAAPANGSRVDRDGLNASLPDVIVLNASVPGYVPDGVSITFTANRTAPTAQTGLVLGQNTTSGGYAVLHYNPNSSFSAGLHVWWPSSDNGENNGTRTYQQFGAFNVSFRSATVNPNATYMKPNVVVIDANLSSYGPETVDQLNGSYAASLNLTLELTNASTEYYVLNYSGSYWNVSRNLPVEAPRGYWNASLNGSADYFYVAFAENRSFNVLNIPPTSDSPIINSSTRTNFTDENLSAYPQNVSDIEGDPVSNITDWRLNGTSISVLNAPFDTAVSDNGSGLVRDYSTFGNNLTLGGGNSSWMPAHSSGGALRGAYSFDGVDDLISCSDADCGGTSGLDMGVRDWSIEAWIRTDDTSGQSVIFAKEGASGVGGPDAFRLGLADGGLLHARINAQGVASINSSADGAAVADGSWHHVAVTFDRDGDMVRYVDGSPTGSATDISALAAESLDSAVDVRIGAREDSPGLYFNGSIDNVRVYDRALSPDQIAQFYAEQSGQFNYSTIVSNETNTYDSWSACITPNDGLDDGTTRCTESVFIFGKLESIAPANGSVVDRDSVASDPDSLNLTAFSFDDPNVNISFYMNLSSPVIAGQTDLFLGSVVTNASGYAVLAFDPNSSYYAGNYTWWVEAPNASRINKRDFVIRGGLNATFFDPNEDPDAEYNQTQVVNANVSFVSFGRENQTELNNTYGASLNAYLNPPTQSSFELNLSFQSQGYWSGNYTLPVDAEVGVWNASINATANAFFYPPITETRNFTVYGLSNLSVFDEQDLFGYTTFAGQDAYHFANWTLRDGSPIDNGTCTLTDYLGVERNLSFNSALDVWELDRPYWLEGVPLYSVVCFKEFYWNVTGSDNMSILSQVNVTADYSMKSLGDNEWEARLDVKNVQNYTEWNVSLYSTWPASADLRFNTSVAESSLVTSEFGVNATRWHFVNLTPGQTRSVLVNLSFVDNWTWQPVIGAGSPSSSEHVYG